MRRSSLSFLRCPSCGEGPLESEGEKELLSFGPIVCAACGLAYPLADGILDLLAIQPRDERRPPKLAQLAMESRTVARFYERGLRPALARLDLDPRSERLLFHSLLAPSPGAAILDLSCGTAHLSRELALHQEAVTIFGVDRSAAMLEEARHHLQESGAAVELVRADAAHLPFREGVFEGVLNVAALHLYEDPAAVIAEVARVLEPGGRFVCATLLGGKRPALERIQRKTGAHRWTEEELRGFCQRAGLPGFERILLPPWIIFRVRKESDARESV